MSNAGDDEAYHLLVDAEGVESATADVEYVRRQRRQRGEPTMSRTEAVHRADEHLRSEGSTCRADAETALPNGIQNLWVITYYDPEHPDVVLDGGALVVTGEGEVRSLSSAPGQPELVGVRFPADEEDAWMLPEDWDARVHGKLAPGEWPKIVEFVDEERRATTVYPPAEQVFRAFELTPYDGVRVVILGQDPYHGPGQAHGLAFSVAQGPNPPSLRKILAELQRDPQVSPPANGNLEGWATQGVLLLNTVLTVRAGAANSHRRKGWEQFTDAVISALNDKSQRVVFLLWGAAAQRKAKLVSNPQHRVIRAAHPAARANAHCPLVGSDVFSLANKALGARAIDWARPGP